MTQVPIEKTECLDPLPEPQLPRLSLLRDIELFAKKATAHVSDRYLDRSQPSNLNLTSPSPGNGGGVPSTANGSRQQLAGPIGRLLGFNSLPVTVLAPGSSSPSVLAKPKNTL